MYMLNIYVKEVLILPITDKVSIFGYSAPDVDKRVEELRSSFEDERADLEDAIRAERAEIEELKRKTKEAAEAKPIVIKKPAAPVAAVTNEPREKSEIMTALYDAHIAATEKVDRAQGVIAVKLEKKRSMVLMHEKKAGDMKRDLNNLIDYVDSMTKKY